MAACADLALQPSRRRYAARAERQPEGGGRRGEAAAHPRASWPACIGNTSSGHTVLLGFLFWVLLTHPLHWAGRPSPRPFQIECHPQVLGRNHLRGASSRDGCEGWVRCGRGGHCALPPLFFVGFENEGVRGDAPSQPQHARRRHERLAAGRGHVESAAVTIFRYVGGHGPPSHNSGCTRNRQGLQPSGPAVGHPAAPRSSLLPHRPPLPGGPLVSCLSFGRHHRARPDVRPN